MELLIKRSTMIDRTFGSGLLTQIALDNYNTKSNKDKFDDFSAAEWIRGEIGKNWMIELLCQYDDRSSPKFGDLLWGSHYCSMVLKGELYMRLIPLNHYAFPDKDIKQNKENLNSAGIKVVTDEAINSDGFFSINSKHFKLFKVYNGTDNTPIESELEYIEITNPKGVIEFGTQTLCKSMMSLSIGDMLLRVPYESTLVPTPVAALFYAPNFAESILLSL